MGRSVALLQPGRAVVLRQSILFMTRPLQLTLLLSSHVWLLIWVNVNINSVASLLHCVALEPGAQPENLWGRDSTAMGLLRLAGGGDRVACEEVAAAALPDVWHLLGAPVGRHPGLLEGRARELRHSGRLP